MLLVIWNIKPCKCKAKQEIIQIYAGVMKFNYLLLYFNLVVFQTSAKCTVFRSVFALACVDSRLKTKHCKVRWNKLKWAGIIFFHSVLIYQWWWVAIECRKLFFLHFFYVLISCDMNNIPVIFVIMISDTNLLKSVPYKLKFKNKTYLFSPNVSQLKSILVYTVPITPEHF